MYYCPICDQRHRSSSGIGSEHEEFSNIYNDIVDKLEDDLSIEFMEDLAESLYFTKYHNEVPKNIVDFVKRIYLDLDLPRKLIDEEKNKPDNKDLKTGEIISFLILTEGTNESLNHIYSLFYDYNKNIKANEKEEKIEIFFSYYEDYDFLIYAVPIYEEIILNDKPKNIRIPSISNLQISLILKNIKTKEKRKLMNIMVENIYNTTYYTFKEKILDLIVEKIQTEIETL